MCCILWVVYCACLRDSYFVLICVINSRLLLGIHELISNNLLYPPTIHRPNPLPQPSLINPSLHGPMSISIPATICSLISNPSQFICQLDSLLYDARFPHHLGKSYSLGVIDCLHSDGFDLLELGLLEGYKKEEDTKDWEVVWRAVDEGWAGEEEMREKVLRISVESYKLLRWMILKATKLIIISLLFESLILITF